MQDSKKVAAALQAALSRRVFLHGGAHGLLGTLLGGCLARSGDVKKLAAAGDALGLTAPTDKRFLFVFGALGGASINDSFMALRQGETASYETLNTFPDDWVVQAEGTDLRAVDLEMSTVGPLPFAVKTNQSRFLAKYAQDIMVATVAGTTVAHPVGQARSVSGFDAWNGRTLQEAVAAHYGKDLFLPNVNMASVGYADPGRDPTLPAYAIAEVAGDAAYLPFGLHGFKGVQGAPDKDLVALARRVRDERLEPGSAFFKTFGKSQRVVDWLKMRALQPELERRDLINTLNALEDNKDFPFKSYGLEPNARGATYRELFPNIGADPLQTQALMAYLLVTQGLTCAVTIGIGMNVVVDASDKDKLKLTNTPTGFDYSHNAHRGTQALLWQKTLDTIDRLITMLKATEYKNGESFWSRSMIYIATEFGRDKKRPRGQIEFPSGHNTNNGVVIISPLANGGRVLGGIDKDTLYTYGFDPETGTPTPGTTMAEKQIYAGILHALGVDTSGTALPNMRAMRRKA